MITESGTKRTAEKIFRGSMERRPGCVYRRAGRKRYTTQSFEDGAFSHKQPPKN